MIAPIMPNGSRQPTMNSNKANNGRDEKVHELTQIESQVKVTHVDRDEWGLSQECEHNVLHILYMCACFVRKDTQFSINTTRS